MLDSTYSILKLGYNICDPYAFFTKNGDIIYNESLSLKIYKNSEELFTLNPVMNFWDNKIIPKKWNTEEIRDLNVSKKCIVKSVFDFDTRYYSVVWFLYDSNQTASRSSFMQAKIRAKTCVIQFYNKSDFKYVDALEFSCPSDSKFVQVLPSGKNSIGLLVEGKNICSMHTLNLELDFEGGEDLVRGAPVSH
jgi:hypothetical protein